MEERPGGGTRISGWKSLEKSLLLLSKDSPCLKNVAGAERGIAGLKLSPKLRCVKYHLLYTL